MGIQRKVEKPVFYYVREKYFAPAHEYVGDLVRDGLKSSKDYGLKKPFAIIVAHSGYHHKAQGFPIPIGFKPYLNWIDASIFEVLKLRYCGVNDTTERALIGKEIQDLLYERVVSREFTKLEVLCNERNNHKKMVDSDAFAVTTRIEFRGAYVNLLSNYLVAQTDFIDTYVIAPLAKAPLAVRDLEPIGV